MSSEGEGVSAAGGERRGPGERAARDVGVSPITGVLVATDLQSDSRSVVGAAAAVARLTRAPLHVVHVFTPAAVPPAVRARDPESEDDVVDEARTGLRHQIQALGADVDIATAEVLRRRTVDVGIADAARATAADLVVMGSHAREATSFRLGSTADRVVRTAPVPCLVVRGEPRFPLRRAAVLFDFSPTARAALGLALQWLPWLGLSEAGSRLDVLHVAWPQTPEEEGGAAPWRIEAVREEIARAGASVRRPPAEIRPCVGFSCYPADEAIQQARAERYDLIVLATRGLGLVARTLVGSVALGVLHGAPCPVLVVPPPQRRR